MPFVCNDGQFVFIGTVTFDHQVEYAFNFLCNMLDWAVQNLLVQYAQTSNYIFVQTIGHHTSLQALRKSILSNYRVSENDAQTSDYIFVQTIGHRTSIQALRKSISSNYRVSENDAQTSNYIFVQTV